MGELCLKKVVKTERMVMKNCYYIDSRGPDGEQLQWAVKLFLSKIKVKKMIIAVPQKWNLEGPVRNYLGETVTEELIESERSGLDGIKLYLMTKKSGPIESFQGAVIMIYPTSDLMDRVDDLEEVSDVLMIPWSEEQIIEWVPRWNAMEIVSQKFYGWTELPEKMKERMDTLDSAVNPQTGLRHPADRGYTIKLFKSIKAEGLEIVPLDIKNYLISKKSWSARNANMVFNVADKVVNGKSFRNRL